MSAPWRLLLDADADGGWNMAVDEALLASYAGPDPPAAPTLRLYGWRPAALSLGRSQAAAGACDLRWLRQEGVGLVRRPTGGRAVLHEHERTYAVVGRLRTPPFAGGVLATYATISAALVDALAALGLAARSAARAPAVPPADPSCFAWTSAHEVEIGEEKCIGSAQLRRRGGFLQHGSIVLRADRARLARALGVDGGAEPGGAGPLGRLVRAELDAALVRSFARRCGAELVPAALTPAEELLATRLRSWKYDSAAWTLAGRVGSREARAGPL